MAPVTTRVTRLRSYWCLTFAILLPWNAHAASILCIPLPGARSHQMNLLRVGQELSERGHDFTFLLSEYDTIGQGIVESRRFPGLKVIKFDGPPGMGSAEWERDLPRDPFQVSVTLAAVLV